VDGIAGPIRQASEVPDAGERSRRRRWPASRRRSVWARADRSCGRR